MTHEEVNNLKENDIIIQDIDWTMSIYQIVSVPSPEQVRIVLLDSNLIPEDVGLDNTLSKQVFLSDGVTLQTTQNIICECGAERCGYNSHSHWCPKR